MSVMGQYCKAYPVTALEQYPGWRPKEIERRDDDGIPPAYVFIQDDYTVTGGVFMDEQVVFDEVTAEWKAFCESVLYFRIPEDVSMENEPGMGPDPQADSSSATAT